MPPDRLRWRIAEAIHRAVDSHPEVPQELARRSFYYAHAGARVANSLVAQGYVPTAGALCVQTSRRRFWQLGASVARDTFHCWFVRHHQDRVELVDLTSRSYRTLAEDCGLPWQRRDVPSMLWGWADQVCPRYRIRFVVDREQTRQMHALDAANRRLVEEIAREAVQSLRPSPRLPVLDTASLTLDDVWGSPAVVLTHP